MTQVLDYFRTERDAALRVADPAEIDRQYRYWRFRILATTMVGYAVYYFVRSNINVPIPSIRSELHLSREQLGTVTTIGGLAYGVSKFVNGILGDHANPRYFMAIGLVACAAMNVCFGASSSLLLFGVFWFLNNYFQGMGFPPCAKSMAHWFSPRERGTTFGIWHTSHMVGAGLVGVLTGYIVKYFGWRACFYFPAGIAVAGAIFVYLFLRDTPGSMGLPPVEVYKREESPEALEAETRPDEPYSHILWEYVLKNPYMWLISFANLSVYVLRYCQMTWGPSFLQEDKGFSQVASGWLAFGSEMGGLLGALVAGIIADRIFRGRAGRVCVIAMGLMAVATYGFSRSSKETHLLAGTLFVVMGLLLYVPQMLIAAMAMNLGTKRASAAAVGLTGIIGYGSQIITGWGIGKLADQHGWHAAYMVMLLCSGITFLLMVFTWNVGAHPELERADGHS
ncbi:MAG TPA: MFS transporter [Tepidisphaeraceae bacterium]|jgi:OPA family glycerol-3-phosphate transporter-like MFS transporter/OPA family sugar phosphate sensor protein UhpC-like MFS transporter